MKSIEYIKTESVKNLGSLLNGEEIENFSKGELWDSERDLINKYFSTGARILDLACGAGRISIALSKRGNEVVGIEQIPELVDAAREVSLSTNLNLTYRIGRATELKFKDGQFHYAIFANNGWGRIPGKQQRKLALKEIARVLCPGGKLILCVHQRRYFDRSGPLWVWKLFKYYGAKLFRIGIEEIDFGDLFLTKNKEGKTLKQKRFVHVAGKWEIKKGIVAAGMEIEYSEKMGKISQRDVQKRRGALFKSFSNSKSPVFYVCKKVTRQKNEDQGGGDGLN